MNCNKNCNRLYTSPQGDYKCLLRNKDQDHTPLSTVDSQPQKHWLCENSPTFADKPLKITASHFNLVRKKK